MNISNLDKIEKSRAGAQKALEARTGGTDFCPLRYTLDQIGDKWSMLTVLNLGSADSLRFNELRKRIGGVSQRMLTVSLRSLEADGMVSRTVYPEVPPRVEYQLTELGHGLLGAVLELSHWADGHTPEILAARREFEQSESLAG